MKTKEKILKEALKQFNAQGVEITTTRHIASAMSISQGNLHYHFANKDVIIIELFQNFLKKIEESRKYEKQALFEKEDVYSSIGLSYSLMFKYRFLFRDNETVWRRLSSIRETMLELLMSRRNEIRQIISQYIDQNIFRSDISELQQEYLADQFVFNISSWLNASEYLMVKKNKADHFAKFTFRLWLPYLEPTEMKTWEKLLLAN